ncbi:hypothetical protein ACYCFK_18700 [Stutzerimonas stutzeri]
MKNQGVKIAAIIIFLLFTRIVLADYYSDIIAINKVLDINVATPPAVRYKLSNVQSVVEDCYSSLNSAQNRPLARLCAIYDITGYRLAAIMLSIGVRTPNRYFHEDTFRNRLIPMMRKHYSEDEILKILNDTRHLSDEAMGARSKY